MRAQGSQQHVRKCCVGKPLRYALSFTDIIRETLDQAWPYGVVSSTRLDMISRMISDDPAAIVHSR